MLLLFVIIEFFPLIKYIACVSFVKGRNSLNSLVRKPYCWTVSGQRAEQTEDTCCEIYDA